jgi:hypothetical protein
MAGLTACLLDWLFGRSLEAVSPRGHETRFLPLPSSDDKARPAHGVHTIAHPTHTYRLDHGLYTRILVSLLSWRSTTRCLGT